MSADHAVFPIAECEFRTRNIEPCRPPTYSQPVRMCVGCLGDGRRVLLDQGVPVERTTKPIKRAVWPKPTVIYVEVES